MFDDLGKKALVPSFKRGTNGKEPQAPGISSPVSSKNTLPTINQN